MVENNRTERAPLLQGDDIEQNREIDSLWARVKSFLRRNGVYLIIMLLLVVIFIPLLVQAIRKQEHHDSPDETPSDPSSNKTALCTSPACVLASANILRSLAPE